MSRLSLSFLFFISSLTGCAYQVDWAPLQAEDSTLEESLPATARLAVLSMQCEGSTIRLLDARGKELASLRTGLEWADTLAWDAASGQFLVKGDGELRVIDPQGTWWTVDQAPEESTHGMSFTADGQLLLAQETTLSAQSASGADEELHDISRCFWDATGSGEAGLSIDVMTGTVVRWSPGSSEVEDLFVYTDQDECWHEPGILEQDEGGGVWVGRVATGDITVYDGELAPMAPSTLQGPRSSAPRSTTVVRLSDVEEHAQQVLALASGGKERIYALFTGPTGEGIAEVNRSGEVHSLVSSPSAAIWVDMVALP